MEPRDDVTHLACHVLCHHYSQSRHHSSWPVTRYGANSAQVLLNFTHFSSRVNWQELDPVHKSRQSSAFSPTEGRYSIQQESVSFLALNEHADQKRSFLIFPMAQPSCGVKMWQNQLVPSFSRACFSFSLLYMYLPKSYRLSSKAERDFLRVGFLHVPHLAKQNITRKVHPSPSCSAQGN